MTEGINIRESEHTSYNVLYSSYMESVGPNDNFYIIHVKRGTDETKAKSKKAAKCCKVFFWTLVIDVPLVFITMFYGLYLEFAKVFHFLGFYCEDEEYMHPVREDNVPIALVICDALLFPIVVIFITELLLADPNDGWLERAKGAWSNLLWIYRSYFFGLLINFVIMEFMRYNVGRPRPNFFKSCRPFDKSDCEEGYIRFRKCSNPGYTVWGYNNMMRSFPSSDASISCHSGLFIIWYLQKRAYNLGLRSIFLLPLIQTLAFILTAFISLSGFSTYRHFLSDVFAGFLIGLMTVIYTFIISNHFQDLSGSNFGAQGDAQLEETIKHLAYNRD